MCPYSGPVTSNVLFRSHNLLKLRGGDDRLKPQQTIQTIKRNGKKYGGQAVPMRASFHETKYNPRGPYLRIIWQQSKMRVGRALLAVPRPNMPRWKCGKNCQTFPSSM